MRAILVMALTAIPVFWGQAVRAQSWQMPADDQRCPSRWGVGDQRGAGNWMKPETVVRAAKLIRSGEVFELGDPLTPDPSLTYVNRGRVYNIYTKPAVPVPNTRVAHEELVITELGQIGTQLDGFAHQMYGSSFYNCFQFSDIFTRAGFHKLGVENVGTLMTRGVLIDLPVFKGVDMLPETYLITPEDLQEALASENLALQPGDAVLIYTGWGKLRGKDNTRYGRTSPGIGAAAGEWLAMQDPMLIAADNCCVEARTGQPQDLPVHSMMLIQHGIYLIENVRLEALAAARVYEFAFIVQPLKLKGATGSAVAPVAIR